MDNFKYFIAGSATILLATASLLLSPLSKYTKAYAEGVKDTHKEAFEQGLMIKEIDNENDKVIYRWIETHKLGQE